MFKTIPHSLKKNMNILFPFISTFICCFQLKYGQTQDLAPHLYVHDIVTLQKITLSCFVTIPISVPAPNKIYFETYNFTNLIHVKVAFHTYHSNDISCTNSMETDITNQMLDSVNITENVFDKKRYTKGICHVDQNGRPSREIILTIDPVTNFDLTKWRCVVETINGDIYRSSSTEGDLLTPYGIYQTQSGGKHPDKNFKLHLKLDKNRRLRTNLPPYIPLSCTVEGKSTIHLPNVQLFPRQPWKSYAFRMKENNRIYSIGTDMYGRTLHDDVEVHDDRLHGFKFKQRCEATSQYEATCLDEQYMVQMNSTEWPNPLLDALQCFNYTLFISPNTITNSRQSWDTVVIKSLFDFDHFLHHSFLDLEIKDNVMLEVPSSKGYDCFPLFKSDNRYSLTTTRGTVLASHVSLCPDFHLYFTLYKEIIRGMLIYKRMQVKKIQQPSTNHRPRVTLSCGNTPSARLIYISSGSCEEDSQKWCGKASGIYSVKTATLQNGETRVIEKKANSENKQTHLMTCLWEIYFCFYELRITGVQPSNLILVENMHPERSVIKLLKKPTGFNIMPGDCPNGEEFLSNEKTHIIDDTKISINTEVTMSNLKTQLYDYIEKINSEETFYKIKTNISLDLLNNYCPCQTHPTVCPSSTINGDLFSTQFLFSQVDSIDLHDPLLWCEAFGLKSDQRRLSNLAIEFLCRKETDEYAIKMAIHLLPIPKMEMYNNNDENETVIINCTEIPNPCLEKTSTTVTMFFWNETDPSNILTWTNFHQGLSQICANENHTQKCHVVTNNKTSPVEAWSSTSIAIKKYLLTNFTHMKCSYAYGMRQSRTYGVITRLNKTLQMCSHDDYMIHILKGVDDNNKTVLICQVEYSTNGGLCRIPSVRMELKNKGVLVNSFTCSLEHSTQSDSCFLHANKKQVVVLLSISQSMAISSESMVSCLSVGKKFVVKNELVTNIKSKCIPLPTYFVPVITLNNTDNDSMTISCYYPPSFKNRCEEVSNVNISLMLDASSMFLKKTSMVLARHEISNGSLTCYSPYKQDINCTHGTYIDDPILEVIIPYQFKYFSHMALHPAASMQIYCSVNNENNVMNSRKKFLSFVLEHIQQKLSKENVFAEENLKKTDMDRRKNLNKQKGALEVLIPISILIITFIIIVICIVVCRKCKPILRKKNISRLKPIVIYKNTPVIKNKKKSATVAAATANHDDDDENDEYVVFLKK